MQVNDKITRITQEVFVFLLHFSKKNFHVQTLFCMERGGNIISIIAKNLSRARTQLLVSEGAHQVTPPLSGGALIHWFQPFSCL